MVVQIYHDDDRWIIIKNLRPLDTGGVTFDVWTGGGWSAEKHLAESFQTKEEATEHLEAVRKIFRID